jgi:uracil-DNA glycosylase
MIADWKDLFDQVKEKEYSKTLHSFLQSEYQNYTIYPPRDMVYQAFKLTKPKDLKVVIIGQDPYHNPGQAMGLIFLGSSRHRSAAILHQRLQRNPERTSRFKMNFDNGDLTPWAEQGILLLNAYLTVRAGEPLSHARPEYNAFIADVMAYLDTLDQPIVFMLWGRFAKQYLPTIHNPKHIALTASHPSPMAANYGGWFGQHLFSQCNAYLEKNGLSPIDWRIE